MRISRLMCLALILTALATIGCDKDCSPLGPHEGQNVITIDDQSTWQTLESSSSTEPWIIRSGEAFTAQTISFDPEQYEGLWIEVEMNGVQTKNAAATLDLYKYANGYQPPRYPGYNFLVVGEGSFSFYERIPLPHTITGTSEDPGYIKLVLHFNGSNEPGLEARVTKFRIHGKKK